MTSDLSSFPGARDASRRRPDAPALALDFAWPEVPEGRWREDFFLGAWHPSARLRVEIPRPPAPMAPRVIAGDGWMLASATTGRSGEAGHVHADGAGAADLEAIAFRGYLLEPPMHDRAPGDAVMGYWREQPVREHNGVFAAARIAAGGTRLELLTDALGVSPLYWRRLPSGVVLFATSPRYLSIGEHALDPIAARMLMHRPGLADDASIIPGVRRVPPGTVLRFSAEGMAEVPWFDWRSLPRGDEPLDDDGVAAVERAFQQAMDRSLAVHPTARHALPLSSGYDSRRMLVALHERGIPFEALTVRILQKGDRDLDARFASEMARELGFPHRVLEYATPAQYAADDRVCRTLFTSELTEHTWIVPLVRALPDGEVVVLDGLGGDILSNGPAAFADAALHRLDEARKLDAVIDEAYTREVDAVLRPEGWAPYEAMRAKLLAHLAIVPEGPLRSDLAFMLIRTRRGPGAWSQHLLPAGHVALYPFLDLGFVRAALRFDPSQKLQPNTLHARCFERFWPRYVAFGSSRRIPEGIAPEPDSAVERLRLGRLARLRGLLAECRGAELAATLRERIRARYAALVPAAMASDPIALRIAWWLDPLLMLESHRQRTESCWTPRAAAAPTDVPAP